MFAESVYKLFGKDRHLNENKGVISANRAIKGAKDSERVLVPHFDDQPCTRDYSDWNDLVRSDYGPAISNRPHILTMKEGVPLKCITQEVRYYAEEFANNDIFLTCI